MTSDPTPTADPVRPQPVAGQPLPPAAPVVVTAPARPRGVLDYVLAGALVLAIGGVAFAVGRGTAPAAAPPFPGGGPVLAGSFDPGASRGPEQGFGGPGGLLFGGLTLDGTVTAVDDDSLTLQLADGTEVEVALDEETTYHEATEADPTAVAVGDAVQVRGAGGRPVVGGNGAVPSGPPGGGSITATDVTVNR